MEEENKIRVIAKEFGKPAYVRNIANNDRALGRFIGAKWLKKYIHPTLDAVIIRQDDIANDCTPATFILPEENEVLGGNILIVKHDKEYEYVSFNDAELSSALEDIRKRELNHTDKHLTVEKFRAQAAAKASGEAEATTNSDGNMERKKIRVVAKEVGKYAYETEIENSENAFSRFVGDDYIEIYAHPTLPAMFIASTDEQSWYRTATVALLETRTVLGGKVLVVKRDENWNIQSFTDKEVIDVLRDMRTRELNDDKKNVAMVKYELREANRKRKEPEMG